MLKITSMRELEEWECENAPGAFPCLKELHVSDCWKLKKQLPQQLPSLRKLVIYGCIRFEASLPWVPAIDELHLECCGNLKWESPPSSLKTLHFGGTLMEASLLVNIQQMLVNTCLTSFEVTRCLDMEFPITHCNAFLQTIKIDRSCNSLITFPLHFFPNLVSLTLNSCGNLERFSILEGHHLTLNSLTSLHIYDCPKLVSFPKGFSIPNLEVCWFSHLKNLKSLPEDMHILFPSLQTISLHTCPKLESFPVGGLPSNLLYLFISECPKLVASRMKWNLDKNTSLREFSIKDANVESFPDEGLLPPTLWVLLLSGCSNLQTLDYKGLRHLSSLDYLSVKDCPRLQCLPKEGLPSSISTLDISNCPLLKLRCQKQDGEDWDKIAHIRWIRIDVDMIT